VDFAETEALSEMESFVASGGSETAGVPRPGVFAGRGDFVARVLIANP